MKSIKSSTPKKLPSMFKRTLSGSTTSNVLENNSKLYSNGGQSLALHKQYSTLQQVFINRMSDSGSELLSNDEQSINTNNFKLEY